MVSPVALVKQLCSYDRQVSLFAAAVVDCCKVLLKFSVKINMEIKLPSACLGVGLFFLVTAVISGWILGPIVIQDQVQQVSDRLIQFWGEN